MDSFELPYNNTNPKLIMSKINKDKKTNSKST